MISNDQGIIHSPCLQNESHNILYLVFRIITFLTYGHYYGHDMTAQCFIFFRNCKHKNDKFIINFTGQLYHQHKLKVKLFVDSLSPFFLKYNNLFINFCFGFWFSGKRRSSRLITNSIPEDIKKCYVCHGFEDEVTTELLQCSKCSAVGQQIINIAVPFELPICSILPKFTEKSDPKKKAHD